MFLKIPILFCIFNNFTAIQLNNSTAIPPYVVLGPACNNAAFSTASLTSKYSKDIQVSYAASTPLLSNTRQLPLFYRTVPSYTKYNSALYSLMREKKWWNIAIVHEDEPHYTTAVESLSKYLDARNQQGLKGPDGQSEAKIVDVTGLNGFLDRQNSLMTSTRIFVAMVSEKHAAALICSAFLLGITTKYYQWIFLGDYYSTWQWRTNVNMRTTHRSLKCSEDNLREAMEAAVFITHQQLVSDPEVRAGFNGKQVNFWGRYQSRVQNELERGFQGQFSFRAMATYDAVLAIGHALKQVVEKSESKPATVGHSDITISQSDEHSRTEELNGKCRGRMITQAVVDFNLAMEQTKIEGVNSIIEFNSSSHSPQNPVSYILQVQSNKLLPISRYFPTNNSMNYYRHNFTWKGASFPRDRPVVRLQVASVYIVGVMVGFSILGIAFSFLMILVNLVYRKHKVIKASSPYMNFVIITGCMFGFLCVLFISTENLDVSNRIPSVAYYFLCNIRSVLLSTGFTLSFGALFAKTFRIYWVFRNPWSNKRAAKDGKLFAYIGILLAYDVLILILWMSLHPLSLVMVNLNYNPSTFTEDLYCFCAPNTQSSSAATNFNFLLWIGLMTVPKAVLLAFGIFLVMQTGKIKALFFRDAKFTGFAIFGVMISCGVGVPTAIFTMQFNQANITYIASTSTILTCSYLILLMVFVPKLHLLRKYKKKVPARVLLGLNPSFRVRRNFLYHGKSTSSAGYRRKAVKYGTARQHPISQLSQVHNERIREPELAYPGSPMFTEASQPVRCACQDAVAEIPKNTDLVVGSLEDWWEPAFEESSGFPTNSEVKEAAVCIGGYHGVISVIRTREGSQGNEDLNALHAGISRPHHSSSSSHQTTQQSANTPSHLVTTAEVHLEAGDDYANHYRTPYSRFISYGGECTANSPDSVTVNITKSKSFSFYHN